VKKNVTDGMNYPILILEKPKYAQTKPIVPMISDTSPTELSVNVKRKLTQ
jgi:hypothetical protein